MITLIWDKVFKNEINKICGRQSLKNFKSYDLLKQTISFQIFKGSLPQTFLGPFFSCFFHLDVGSHSLLNKPKVFIGLFKNSKNHPDSGPYLLAEETPKQKTPPLKIPSVLLSTLIVTYLNWYQ